MNVLVCHAQRYPIRRILHCPTCKTLRRMLWHDEAWYGTAVTCCHCGDSWQDGERSQRPNRRGWRTEAAAAATTEWLAAGPYDPAAHRIWLNEQIGTSS
ncbi:hypothetical protein [Streptomyces sp. SID14515]|uniref:hypothetical protein n=1 Tax=Streptomyces sp. SID14515 TaxID=2706074 RepID=UPI0013C654AE|nr:hypothetical protein [Streptomyces sp. SID14515]NEB42318.1 hypothetical protein [Streptomyces sp. SID14515]